MTDFKAFGAILFHPLTGYQLMNENGSTGKSDVSASI